MTGNDETVLVTGGSGFIGSHVCARLAAQGKSILSFDINPPQNESAWILRPFATRIKFVEGDIGDKSALESLFSDCEIDDVVHIAAIADSEYLRTHPEDAIRVNLGGTLNVLEAARIHRLRRLIYFSSIALLPNVRYEPVDVDHPTITGSGGPGSGFYGAAKLAGEAFCFAYNTAFNLDFIAIRPSAVYGLGMLIPNHVKPFVEGAVNGDPVNVESGGSFGRDYTHVSDIAQLVQCALDTRPGEFTDRIFFGATGQPLTTPMDVVAAVRELVPGSDVSIGPELTGADRWKSSFRAQLDISNAEKQLGYKPVFNLLRDGLAEYVNAYRKYATEAGT